MRRVTAITVMGLMACFCGRVAKAAAPPPTKEGIDFFEKKIRPVLVQHCYECHSEEKKKIKGKLRLDDYESMLKGGESKKPSVVPGDPDKSLLIFSMTYTDKDTDEHDALLMPPPKNGKPQKLPDSIINDFREWIKMGAPYPQKSAQSQAAPAAVREHWAFVNPRDPPVPQVRDVSWIVSPIDNFVLAKLEEKNLHPTRPADKRALIRRAYYDLIGLPPTIQEVEAFEADASSDAFAKVVDHLLSSPHYGERWGRYWLDIARYSDTKGYVFEEERRYPYAYTYRDWVIRAFNDDLPYDRFLIDQIAADKLDLHGDNAALAAEGFLTLGRRFLNNLPDIIDDRMDVVFRGTMALTVGCARCHDHKFDPIPTKDYYALYAIFANSPEAKDPPELGKPHETEAYHRFTEELNKRRAALDGFINKKLEEVTDSFKAPTQLAAYLLAAQFDAPPQDAGYPSPQKLYPRIVGRWKSLLAKAAAAHDPVFSAWRAYAAVPRNEFAANAREVTEKLLSHSEEPVNPFVAQAFADQAPTSMNEVADGYARLLNQYDSDDHREYEAEEQLRQVLRSPDAPIRLTAPELSHFLKLEDHHEWVRLRTAVDQLKVTDPGAPPRPMSLQDVQTVSEQRVFIRGNPANEGDIVKSHFLTLLAGPDPEPYSEGSGRLELARAIADKHNPLTARVMVNRVWLHHFGKGLVGTASDFGMRSEPPTHPELLDWLAIRFMEGGWSIKNLHRLIMLSATYQQGSDADPATTKLDPDNALLSHFNRRRLDWEATRDSLLIAGGRLDSTMFGRPVDFLSSTRRTIYGFIDRQNLPGVMRSFDFASPDTTSAQRFTTTVPQQALFLMNSPFAVEQAQHLVQRPEVASETDPSRRIAQLYRIAFDRTPTPDELTLGARFVATAESTNHRTVVWQYGYGELDQTTHRTARFTPLPHFTGEAYQGGEKLPDPKLGWVTLNARGGHPGNDQKHAAIRRWVSPIDGIVSISGMISHKQTEGDGVRAHVVSSRLGELASWNVFHMNAGTNLDGVEVKRGDTIDFIVDCRDSVLDDSFEWAPVIKSAAPQAAGNDGPLEWSAATGFTAPEPQRLDVWVRYAQALLESNEFVFID